MVEESFPLGAIPERLKCAQCTSLARDAWKLACCDQIICGTCYEKLPTDACPICAFSPFEKDKCVPSTSLRTTIAVFLRHAEKRHNDALAKEAKENELKAESKEGIVEAVTSTTEHDASNEVANQQDYSNPQSGNYVPEQQNMPNYAQYNGMANSNANVFGQQRQENGNMFANNPFPMGMGMGFDPMMMGGFPMGQFNPMMMAQMAMSGGYGGYGNNGMDWNQGMGQFTTQNMNLQTEENTSPDLAQNAGGAIHEDNNGSFHGYHDAPRGPKATNRNNKVAHRGPSGNVPPVYVEGAPTGPSAMRNGTDARNVNSRGRGGPSREVPMANNGRSGDSDQGSKAAIDTMPAADQEPVRGRSMTRSVTRDRSMSPRRRRSPLDRIASRSRERSPVQSNKQRSQASRSRSREPGHRRRRNRGRGGRSERERRERSLSRDARKSSGQDPISLADRIDRLPARRSRSRSPRPENRGQQSSNKSRRQRSRSKDNEARQRSPSRSPERKASSRSERRRHRDRGRRHRRRRGDGPKDGDNGNAQGNPRRGTEGDKGSERSSRRSNAKYEIKGSPELRRIEEERERSRYN